MFVSGAFSEGRSILPPGRAFPTWSTLPGELDSWNTKQGPLENWIPSFLLGDFGGSSFCYCITICKCVHGVGWWAWLSQASLRIRPQSLESPEKARRHSAHGQSQLSLLQGDLRGKGDRITWKLIGQLT